MSLDLPYGPRSPLKTTSVSNIPLRISLRLGKTVKKDQILKVYFKFQKNSKIFAKTYKSFKIFKIRKTFFNFWKIENEFQQFVQIFLRPKLRRSVAKIVSFENREACSIIVYSKTLHLTFLFKVILVIFFTGWLETLLISKFIQVLDNFSPFDFDEPFERLLSCSYLQILPKFQKKVLKVIFGERLLLQTRHFRHRLSRKLSIWYQIIVLIVSLDNELSGRRVGAKMIFRDIVREVI